VFKRFTLILATIILGLLSSLKFTFAQDNSSIALLNLPELSLSELPGINEAGCVEEASQGSQTKAQNRCWERGDRLDSILKNRDLSAALGQQKFELGQIWQITSLDPQQIAISSFPLLARQTLEQLVKAVPQLGEYRVNEVEPVRDLIGTKFGASNQTIAQAIENNPELKTMALEEIDLDKYSLSQIPNLKATKLENLAQWEDSSISEVPNLSRVPLNLMPNPVKAQGNFIARIDQVWDDAENSRHRTATGSDLEGYAVSCDLDCPSLELDDLENEGKTINSSFEGTHAISGKDWREYPSRRAMGGEACAIGPEPVGRQPFGSFAKVVVWDVRQDRDYATLALFFHYYKWCGASFHPTPKEIGPFIVGTVRRDDLLFLGRGEDSWNDFCNSSRIN
jgi:hypothetical protein